MAGSAVWLKKIGLCTCAGFGISNLHPGGILRVMCGAGSQYLAFAIVKSRLAAVLSRQQETGSE